MNYYISIVYIDLDNFKEVNDSLGHKEGDEVLRTAAQTLKNNVRDIDVIARLGGDEFGILIPDLDYEEAKKAIIRLKSTLDNIMCNRKWNVTASIGAVTCPKGACSVDSLIKMADNLMYEVKSNGKNGIIHNNVDQIPEFKFSKIQGGQHER